MAQYDLLATSGFGLETLVRREIEALGYEAKIISPGRILFRGDEAAIREANLWLRTAERVLIRMASAQATDFGQLFDLARATPWHEWIPFDGIFPVNGRSHKSQLASVPACQKIVKKAIVEQLREGHQTVELPETGVEFPIEVIMLNDEATLVLDTTGVGLHKRGYRYYVGEAPLRETLSAALVQLSHWKPEQPFWDPFCGSGTLAIEAALIGRNIAPGLNREFLCEQWPRVGGPAWDEVRESARQRILPSLPEPLLATDLSEEALRLARSHAEAAGVENEIHFQNRNFHDLSSKRKYGCLISNPPYGERMGEKEEIEELYRAMPEVLRRLKTWSHYLITARADFEKLVGQKASKRRKLYNGRLECTYYQFHGPRPNKRSKRSQELPDTPADTVLELPENESQAETEADGSTPVTSTPAAANPSAANPTSANPASASPTTANPTEASPASATPASAIPTKPKPTAQPAQAFGGLLEESVRQSEEFANRLRNRARHLRRWPTKRGITCFRLYDRDVPDVPLAVDRYEDSLVVAEYERPHERTPAEHGDWLDLMLRTLSETLEVPRDKVFLKRRERQQGESQYSRVADERSIHLVNEGGLRFRTNLSDYLDTGLFLDHRQTRKRVRDEAEGKRFLNLFAYTGSFTVYAADGGAKQTTTVDLSKNYLDWAEANLKLNDMAAGDKHRMFREDSRDYVNSLPKEPLFDLAMVDPPTFSNSKRTDEDWDVQRDAVPLLNELSDRMSVGGVIYFSTNFRRFKFAESALTNLTSREISKQTVPEDFRNQRIHRCWRLVRTES